MSANLNKDEKTFKVKAAHKKKYLNGKGKGQNDRIRSNKKMPLEWVLAELISTHPEAEMVVLDEKKNHEYEIPDPSSTPNYRTAKCIKSSALKELKIWDLKSYEEWMNGKGYDFQLNNDEGKEMFKGREIESIIGCNIFSEKEYVIIRTKSSPDEDITLVDIIHGVEIATMCRLFPKMFLSYTNFIASSHVQRRNLIELLNEEISI